MSEIDYFNKIIIIMRNFRYSLSLILLFNLTTIHSQITEGNFADCDKHNKFLRTSTSISSINNFAEEIRSDGTIIFDQNKTKSFNGISDLYTPLRLTPDHTFAKTGEYISRINNQKKTVRYQQYFKGIKVEGGGYSERRPNGPGPDNPCLEIYSLTPYLATDINVSTNPAFSMSQIKTILANHLGISVSTFNIVSTELVISPNLKNDCQFKLAWKVIYTNQSPKISWIDAINGDVLKTIEGNVNINAPTITYGIQNLNDRFDGTRTNLESPNQNIRIFEGNCILNTPQNGGNWDVGLIPNTTNTTWTNESTQNAYQTFHVTSQVIPLFQNIGVNFNNVNISVCDDEGAFSLIGSTVENTFINIGTLNNRPLSLFDVIAHELGHTYLNQFLDYSTLGNASLHEGISDIIGTFIESLIQGNLDWIMGDDEPNVANDPRINRNLSLQTCLTNVQQEQHFRGVPIGHLFFLLTQGDANLGITSLGAQRTINIILDALADIPRDADYPQLRAAILNNMIDEFGRCSPEFLSFARAFENICVPTGFAVNGAVPACSFTINGPNQVCEESNQVQFCAQGTMPPNAYYHWTIIGPNSTEFTSLHGMQGNSQEGGNCLFLTSFPQFPYYPQYITIQLYSPITGLTQTKRLKIIDCDHDDPTCAEYYSLPRTKQVNLDSENVITEPIKMRVIDLMGRIVYSGQVIHKDELILNRNIGLLIFQYFDLNGIIIKTEKSVRF